MGGCINVKDRKLALDMPAEYLRDEKTAQGFIIPLETTLFNLLRKPNQLQIIRYSSTESKIFIKETAPNLRSLTPIDLKMLYSFKNILIVGNVIDEINLIKSSANPKQIFCISENFASSFLDKFMIFKAKQPILQPKYIPIYVFNSEQIEKKGPKKQIFIHSEANQNKNIYPNLGIKQILQDNPASTSEQTSKIIQNCPSSKILFLHSKQRKPDDLLAILSLFASNQYGINLLNAQIYTRKSLPQTSLNIDKSFQLQNQAQQNVTSIPKQELTLTQIYQKYLQQLCIQMGNNENAKNKVDRAYNLLITLLSNIYNNKNSQSYRVVRKTNPQVNELLGKYKNGIKLLNEVGFIDKGSSYANSTDVKYLKIYRTDLDMAYRNYINQT